MDVVGVGEGWEDVGVGEGWEDEGVAGCAGVEVEGWVGRVGGCGGWKWRGWRDLEGPFG